MTSHDTLIRHAQVIASAKKLFNEKKAIYGDSWKLMDIHYLADRMMVKCERITQLLSGQAQKVDEGIPTELTDIINYAIIGLIQLKKGSEASPTSLSDEEVEVLYDNCVSEVCDTLKKKNHDYNDAWLKMRYASLITQIKVKLSRILHEDSSSIQKDPASAVDQFQDTVNYAVFALLHPEAPYNKS